MTAPSALHNVPAPAKLNLFLHITGRLPNGYHLLQSVLVLVDWMDWLDFTPSSDGRISRTQQGGATLPDDDLCTRAARALQQATGCRQGVHIHIRKSIPEQAGMGGGSSDAATCLLALNRLWQLGLTRQQLSQIGLTLGADVPFFLFGHNAWAEGIGEQLQAISVPHSHYLVVKPQQGAATAEIFASPHLPRNTKPATMADFAASANPLLFGQNDMQAVASAICPDMQEVLHCLEQAGLQPRMTGSGSAVFAALPQQQVGLSLLESIHWPSQWKAQVCQSLHSHPLLQWAA